MKGRTNRCCAKSFTTVFYIFAECKASTVKCENGSSVCLPFNVSVVKTYSIRRQHKNLCTILKIPGEPFVYSTNWSNKTLNCSFSAMKMTLCFGDCQLEDAGNFSVYNGTTPSSSLVQSLTLQIISNLIIICTIVTGIKAEHCS